MKQVFSVVDFLHKRNILIRAIQPENFFLAAQGTFETLKLFDFFHAVKISPDETIHCEPLIEYYSAPELLKDNLYNKSSEMWACGVLLHSILEGDMRTVVGQSAKFDITRIIGPESKRLWETVSKDTRELLISLLSAIPQERVTAEEALKKVHFEQKPIKSELKELILKNIKFFKTKNRFHQFILLFIIEHVVTQIEKFTFRCLFDHFDMNNEGIITKTGMLARYSKLREDPVASRLEVNSLFSAIEADNLNYITFKEFLKVALDKSWIVTKKNLIAAFKILDMDGDGYIQRDDLAIFLGASVDLFEEE